MYSEGKHKLSMSHYVDSTDCFSGVLAYTGWIQAP